MKRKWDKRGRHKKAHSPETVTWNREHQVPERPSWMDQKTYVQLNSMRAKMERP